MQKSLFIGIIFGAVGLLLFERYYPVWQYEMRDIPDHENPVKVAEVTDRVLLDGFLGVGCMRNNLVYPSGYFCASLDEISGLNLPEQAVVEKMDLTEWADRVFSTVRYVFDPDIDIPMLCFEIVGEDKVVTFASLPLSDVSPEVLSWLRSRPESEVWHSPGIRVD